MDDRRSLSVRRNFPLGEFLRTRRALVDPAAAGIPYGIRRRRVAGLRREELADLAGVSVDYYTRLEQGRHATASYAVLEAIANALQLPPADRAYLHGLADSTGTDRVAVPERAQVRPETLALLRALDPMPAVVLGPSLDVLASNAGARRLYEDFEALPVEERNALRLMLFSPQARRLHGDDWAGVVTEMIGILRLQAGRKLTHPDVQRLVASLARSSEFFRRVWADQTVSTGSWRVKRFQHPLVGPVEFALETLLVKNAREQTVVVFMLPAGSPQDRAWRAMMAREESVG